MKSCIPCNVLSDRMKDYVAQYGLQNLTNINSPYAFAENHITSHIELEGLEKMNFMVGLFEPYKGENPYRSPDHINEKSTVINKDFDEVQPISTSQNVTFTADFGSGEVSNVKGENNDITMGSWIVNTVTGRDQSHLDFDLSKEGMLTIKIKIGGSEFTVTGKSDGKNLNVTTKISGVSKDIGGIINAASADDGYNIPFTIGTKQGGTEGDQKQNNLVPYSITKDGKTDIPTEYRGKKNKDAGDTSTRTL